MRILSGRSYGELQTRNPHLRRYAFIGDSYTYGQGVGPDETLPALCERYLNESPAEGPVEAVNLGVRGYNLWNSWCGFKRLPAVFDGLVLVLCSNDTQLLQKTYQIPYTDQKLPLWQPEHPFRGAVASCFDEIAACGLPAAVCYYNFWPHAQFQRIGQNIAELCRERGLPFVDFFPLFQARKLPFADLVVSEADYHGSALANDVAARQLATALRGEGPWRGRAPAVPIETVPDLIAAAAGEMVGKEGYPCDAGVRWAGAALESAARGARRSHGREAAEGFRRRAEAVGARLKAARELWHAEARLAAQCLDLFNPPRGMSDLLWRLENEKGRLEELHAVAGAPDLPALVSALPAALPEPAAAPAPDRARLGEGLERLRASLRALVAAQREAVAAHRGAWLQPRAEIERFAADSAQIEALAGEVGAGAAELADLMALCERAWAEPAPGAPPALRQVHALMQASLAKALECLEAAGVRLAAAAEAPAAPGDFTTVDVTVAGEPLEGRHPCTLLVHAHPLAPRAFSVRDMGYFLPRGEPTLVRFRFPMFYAGHLTIEFKYPPEVAERVRAGLASVVVYNSPHRRQTIAPSAFAGGGGGGTRLVSPHLCLS